jgi:dolichol-phosphate mannosyltransferase
MFALLRLEYSGFSVTATIEGSAPMRPAVIIPTFNESDNLAALIDDLHTYTPELTIVVVDDNSPDGTGQLADQIAAQDPRVHPLHRPRKLGLGTAHIAGLKWAMSQNLEPILTMDADFSHSPRYVPDLIRATGTYDLVIGSRYVPGGGALNCTLPRIALSRGANTFARLLLGLKATDCTAGFRAYRRAVLDSIDLDAIVSDGYSFLIEVLYQCQKAGWRIGEVPILFEDRRHGKSKVSKQEIAKALNTVVRLRLESGRLPRSSVRRRTVS